MSRPAGQRATSSTRDRELRWPVSVSVKGPRGSDLRVWPSGFPVLPARERGVELEGLKWGHFDCILGLAGPPDGKREAQYDFEGSGAGCGQGRVLR